MRRGARTGDTVARQAMGLKQEDVESQPNILQKRLQEAHHAKDDGEMKDLDLQMKGNTDEIQNNIAK